MKNQWQKLPPIFLERLISIVPSTAKESVLESFCHERPTSLRVNTLKIKSDELISRLTKEGFILINVPFWENAFLVKNDTLQKPLVESPLYKEGLFYIQSLSSMIPPLVLAPQKNEKILDLCAAPGSKTTQIAQLVENSGEIIANDNSRIRVFKLIANLKTLGVTNVKTQISHGQTLWSQYPGYFDRSLVDVPCSMEGRFNTHDPKTYEFWSTKKIKELRERQRFLLRSAISATKVGGVIVYSTCTLAPEENEDVIDWILKKEAGKIETEEIKLKKLETQNTLDYFKEKQYSPQVKKSVRILPSETMEGFFIAKLRKLKENT